MAEGVALVLQGAATSEIIAAGVAITGTVIVMNGVNQYNRDRNYSVQDNTNIIKVILKPIVKTENSENKPNINNEGKRRKNRLPDKGEPNTTQTNDSGTTTKVYGPNGEVVKEYNKGHTPVNTPENERDDHVHDYKPKPNPNNPDARERQGGRKPKPDELEKDKKRQEKRRNLTPN